VLFLSSLDPAEHDQRVQRVQAAVIARLERPESERKFMCTARAPWMNLSTRFASYKKNSDCIDVADFRNIISLDEENLTVTLEPLVDVGTITRYLVPRGYMLATTLEIEEATIGGLAMAVGMTTASHKYGLLQETVSEYEVILGNGRVVKVTKDNEFSDLYYTIPWSHGSLCLLLQLTLKIIPVKKYVKVEYQPVLSGLRDYCEVIRKVSLDKNPADFVEATVFSRSSAVIMTGTFADTADGKINNVGLWFKPWFYTHVRDMLGDGLSKNTEKIVEYVPTYEYIFRHNRGIFWTLKDQLPEKYGNNVVFRYLLGWLCPPKVTFLKLPATPAIRKEMMTQRVYQDIVLPLETLEEAISKAADLFEIWPILVYPSRIYDHGSEKQGQFRKPRNKVEGEDYGMFYDLGVYGIPKPIREGKTYNSTLAMREMEELTRRTGGAPFLYADTFMDREEFSHMFDLGSYERVRTKYEADKHFPHLYDKTSGCQSFDWKKMLEEESNKKDQ